MAITRTQAYRRLVTNEVTDGEGYNARFVRDAARNCNVSHAFALATIIVPNQAFPGGYTIGSETADTYRMSWAPVTVPRRLRHVRVRVNAKRVGSGTYTLRFFAGEEIHPGAATAPVGTVSGTVDVSSATADWVEVLVGPFTIDPFVSEPQVHLTMYSKSSDGGTHATLYVVHAVLEFVA